MAAARSRAAGAQVDVQTRDNTVRVWTSRATAPAVLQGHSDYVGSRGDAGRPARRVRRGRQDRESVGLGKGVELAALPGHTDILGISRSRRMDARPFPGDRPHADRLGSQATQTPSRVAGHRSWVIRIAIAADNRTAVSASLDGTLKRWDLTNGEALATFSGHAGAVHTLVFSPDGRLALSGSADKTLRLWDVATGQARATLRGHPPPSPTWPSRQTDDTPCLAPSPER